MGVDQTFDWFQIWGEKKFKTNQKECLYIQNQVIETRMNSMFELATQDEIDKLRTNDGSDSKNSDEELQLDDLEVRYIFELEME